MGIPVVTVSYLRHAELKLICRLREKRKLNVLNLLVLER